MKKKRSNYPQWLCPTLCCPYRTSYAKNIGHHLKFVHRWADEDIQKELDYFFECAENGAEMICSKDPKDPTRPRGGLCRDTG